MSVKIRKLKASELHIIKGLDLLCFGADKSEAPSSEIHHSEWWAGFDEVTPVCFAGAYVYADKACGLLRAGVLPNYRGQGLQKRLIDVRLKHAIKHKCDQAFTYVAPWNAASLNSLISLGFKAYRPECPDTDWDYVHMVRWLNHGKA
jgi:GNAT superfamily N-acetyltransferase